MQQRLTVKWCLYAGILEVAKAARLLSDIATLDAEVDLSGLDVIDTDADFVEQTAAQVRAQAEVRLSLHHLLSCAAQVSWRAWWCADRHSWKLVCASSDQERRADCG